MRIYIPLTPLDLTADITPRLVHAVTAELKMAVPNEDAEGWEMIATLAAADESLRRLGQTGASARRRMLCVAEVHDRVLAPADDLPSARELTAAVSWADVETILVDEPGSEALVDRALAGDDQAFMSTGDIDLMWYDIIERSALAQELG
ncbi:DUF6912 family protein [Trueperella pecoris]|uniref:Uncharacterized protein n=1 Tax=Trueperella pecoris TaxID=2733571 RepID=A0A7M1QX43_9ACTO|nr:hypothetical protein [Trueperella pecoris]QOR46074.1 hypothetical protein INS88_02325 [Trueperella pecoris]